MRRRIKAHGLQPVGFWAHIVNITSRWSTAAGRFAIFPRRLLAAGYVNKRGETMRIYLLESDFCADVYALGPKVCLPRQVLRERQGACHRTRQVSW